MRYYSLGGYSLGGYNLGGYSLGGYSLGGYSLCHRFGSPLPTHLSRNNIEDPSTYPLFREYIYIYIYILHWSRCFFNILFGTDAVYWLGVTLSNHGSPNI